MPVVFWHLASCLALRLKQNFYVSPGLRLNAAHGQRFSSVAKQKLVRQKIAKFQDCLLRPPLIPPLPYEVTEDLDTNCLAVQSLLRIARNDAGHPTGAAPQREQVYVYLQLFVPFARQLMRLRRVLA